MADLKKTTDATRNKSYWRWAYGNLTCFSQEHMQTFGYLAAMLPIVDELYDDDAEKVEALSTYSTFFNTEPQLGSLVVGLTVGLEEARANGDDIDDETINGIRAGLMGPLAGLGDSIIVGTLIPNPPRHRPWTLNRGFAPRRHLLHRGMERPSCSLA